MARTNEITLPDDFTSTMQQLVAEAKKTVVPAQFSTVEEDRPAQSDDVRREFASVNERIAALERIIESGFEKLASYAQTSQVPDQLQRLDEQMVALRNTETVNQRLFNTLHHELKSYRDNFLRESLQKPFLRDLVMLFDDLSELSAQMGSATGKGAAKQWSANLENAIHSLIEILHRMEVNEIEPKEKVDRNFHRVVSYEPADFAEEDGLIVMRLKRGFVWRDQVLRPEEVVAKRFA